MLAKEDLALCERDTALPGLRLALDLDALQERLRARGFAFGDASLESVTVRYAPGDRVLVGLRSGETSGYLHAWAGETPKKAVDGEDICVLDDARTVVCRWPTDLRLGAARKIPRVLEALGLGKVRTRDIGVLSYRPERRAALRVVTDSGVPHVVKLYRSNGYEKSLPRWRWLRSLDSVATPAMTANADKYSALSLEWLSGQTLAALMRAGTATVDQPEQAGRALARLHASDPGELPTAESARLTSDADAAVATLAILAPTTAELAEDIVRRAKTVVGELPATTTHAIHGDFHAKQVLVTESGEAALLDLDDAIVGAPITDLASHLAHLHRDECAGLTTKGSATHHMTAFLSGYASPPPERELQAGTALALLAMASYPFRTRQPSWHDATAQILARARQLLDD